MRAIWSIPDIAFPLHFSTFLHPKKLSGKPKKRLAAPCKFSPPRAGRERCRSFPSSFFLAREDLRTQVCEQKKILPLHDNKHFLVVHLKTNEQTNKQTTGEEKKNQKQR